MTAPRGRRWERKAWRPPGRQDPYCVIVSLRHLGDAARRAGDLERARAFYEESLAGAHAENLPQLTGWPLCGLALIALGQGEPERARALARECLAIWREQGDR